MISDWIHRFGYEIRDVEPSLIGENESCWKVVDAFTTIDGEWYTSDKVGSIPQWAIDQYHTASFDDAGGSQHLFFRFEDENGVPAIRNNSYIYTGRACQAWTDGYDKLLDQNYRGYVQPIPFAKDHSGWGNIVMFEPFWPDQGQHGPWCIKPFGPCETVTGIGLPYKYHISTFIVWRESGLDSLYKTIEEAMAHEAQKHQVIQFNPDAALQKMIFKDGYVPNSPEFDVEFEGELWRGQRSERLDNGNVRVYYAKVGVWDMVFYTDGIIE